MFNFKFFWFDWIGFSIVYFLLYISTAIYPSYTLFHLHPHCFHPQSLHHCPCSWVLFLFLLDTPTPATPQSWQHAFSLWVCLYFACYFSLFITFHIWVKSYGISLSLTGLFHLAKYSLCPSMLLKGWTFSSVLWPGNILLCKCTIVILPTHLLMDTLAASKSWLLLIMLQ